MHVMHVYDMVRMISRCFGNRASFAASCEVQVVWRLIKANIREHAQKGDKVVPFLLKFRDIVERLGHHLMVERLVAVSEAGVAYM